MTAAELLLLSVILRRAADLTPDVAAKLLAAFAVIRDSFTDAQLARLLPLGIPEQIVAVLIGDSIISAALLPVRNELRTGILTAVKYFQRQLPTIAPAAPGLGTIGIRFDTLNPRVLDAIRSLEGTVMTALTDDVKAVVRATVERGLREGLNSSAVAAELRSVIGLGPTQWQRVQNFRDALNGLNGRKISDYTLRDMRFRAPTTPEQVEKQVAAYTKRRIAQNAATTARAASLQSLKLGQRLSWQDAIDQGYVDGALLKRRWKHLPGQEHPRPTHEAMDGEVAPFDQPYSNGDTYAGENDPWNCFIGTTEVEGAFVLGLKALYTGPLREIVTARGYRLTVTPNHPILTNGGWVAAGKLDKGSCLFSKRREIGQLTRIDVDHQHKPTAIQDVFDAIAPQRPIPPGVTLDLHGDARCLVGDVDVVMADRQLAFKTRQGVDEGVNDRRLSNAASDRPAIEDGDGTLAALCQGTFSPANGAPRVTEQVDGRATVAVNALPSQALAVGSAADWDAPVPKIFGEGTASVSTFVRQLIEASSQLVTADEIVDVRDYHAVEVHVYDLQSINGWLLASNIVCSNCHCHDMYFIDYGSGNPSSKRGSSQTEPESSRHPVGL